ncbi:MAG TPA: sensor histidine kinase [Gaiellales bacterium]|nr:sensor histidine kinase [Gaiellales bacterium]
MRMRVRRLAATFRRHPTAADAAFAAVLAAAALVSVYATFELLRQDPAFKEPAKPGILLAILAVMLPLALRRRFPLAVACVVIGAFVIGRLVIHPDIPALAGWEGTMTVWACWIALYSAVVHGRKTRLTTLVVILLAAVLLGEVVREVFFYGGGTYGGLPLNEAVLLAYNVVSIALPILLGLAVRSRRDRERELAARTSELQSEREENARSAVLEERVRIARELHDVVAHHVSVMGVQAGAARRVMRQQPAKAEEVLSSIEASSRQAVLELQRLLGVLRRTDQPDELTPQPDLAQLPELVANAGQGGLTVELSIEGEPRALPRTLEVSAYRVIQEALTNALRHSGGTTATVRVDYQRAVLEVEVLDDGRGNGRAPGTVGGHGLMGMRERVGLHGGHLRAGRRPEGGFAVHATFPLNGGSQ